MKLSQFKFKLPDEKIALYPRTYDPTTGYYSRDEAKMLVLHRRTGEIENRRFKEIIDFFDDGDTFVFNDTKVFPARLYGNKEKTNARIEVFLLRELNAENHLWDVLVDPARKIRIGNKLYFGEDDSMVAEVIDNTTSRGRTLRFLYDGTPEDFKRDLYALGEAPIPDDVRNLRKATPEDMEMFQTIYASKEGAVTAPATGLHFSRELLKRLEIKGINQTFLTLHAGLGNFRSIDVEDLTKHKTDSEQVFVSAETCDMVNTSKANRRKVCAVGSTVLRALETVVGPSGLIKEFEGWTNKFIFPPYEFAVADAYVSNFAQPLSALLMLQCSFGGYELVMDAYRRALEGDYKFGTYGDALLIVN